MNKRLTRLVAAAVAVLALGACSMEWHIENAFGPFAGPAAVRVAKCESNLNPEARSPGGGNHGLFQINTVHRQAFTQVTGQSWDQIYHPGWNAMYAKHLYDNEGWRPWTCKP